MQKNKKNQYGFTLLETIIATSIFVVVALVVGTLFIYHTQIYKSQEKISSFKLQKSLFSKHLRTIGESAKAVSASYNIGGNLRTSASSTIVFQVPAIDASGDIIENTYDYIALYREGANLFMETEADPASQRKDIKQKVADSVDTLFFRYDSPVPASSNSLNGYLYLKSNKAKDSVNVGVFLRNK